MTTKFKQFLLFFMVLLLSAGQVMAQDNRAVISGIVTDETGMGVIGAAIQVKNESTGFNTVLLQMRMVNIPSSSYRWVDHTV